MVYKENCELFKEKKNCEGKVGNRIPNKRTWDRNYGSNSIHIHSKA
jgi:hypothetical protein